MLGPFVTLDFLREHFRVDDPEVLIHPPSLADMAPE